VPHVELGQGDSDGGQRGGKAIEVGFDGGQVVHAEGLFERDMRGELRCQEARAKAPLGIERPLAQRVMGYLINKESHSNAHGVLPSSSRSTQATSTVRAAA
jgi:hypothetical protein